MAIPIGPWDSRSGVNRRTVCIVLIAALLPRGVPIPSERGDGSATFDRRIARSGPRRIERDTLEFLGARRCQSGRRDVGWRQHPYQPLIGGNGYRSPSRNRAQLLDVDPLWRSPVGESQSTISVPKKLHNTFEPSTTMKRTTGSWMGTTTHSPYYPRTSNSTRQAISR
jgi:hypothetical protein